MTVRHAIKGYETHTHDTAAQARMCTELGGPDYYFEALDAQDQADAEFAAEAVAKLAHAATPPWTWYFEDRGYWEARAQEDHERESGCLGFLEAWHLASPDTCPCDDHDNEEEVLTDLARRERELAELG